MALFQSASRRQNSQQILRHLVLVPLALRKAAVPCWGRTWRRGALSVQRPREVKFKGSRLVMHSWLSWMSMFSRDTALAAALAGDTQPAAPVAGALEAELSREMMIDFANISRSRKQSAVASVASEVDTPTASTPGATDHAAVEAVAEAEAAVLLQAGLAEFAAPDSVDQQFMETLVNDSAPLADEAPAAPMITAAESEQAAPVNVADLPASPAAALASTVGLTIQDVVGEPEDIESVIEQAEAVEVSAAREAPAEIPVLQASSIEPAFEPQAPVLPEPDATVAEIHVPELPPELAAPAVDEVVAAEPQPVDVESVVDSQDHELAALPELEATAVEPQVSELPTEAAPPAVNEAPYADPQPVDVEAVVDSQDHELAALPELEATAVEPQVSELPPEVVVPAVNEVPYTEPQFVDVGPVLEPQHPELPTLPELEPVAAEPQVSEPMAEVAVPAVDETLITEPQPHHVEAASEQQTPASPSITEAAATVAERYMAATSATPAGVQAEQATAAEPPSSEPVIPTEPGHQDSLPDVVAEVPQQVAEIGAAVEEQVSIAPTYADEGAVDTSLFVGPPAPPERDSAAAALPAEDGVAEEPAAELHVAAQQTRTGEAATRGPSAAAEQVETAVEKPAESDLARSIAGIEAAFAEMLEEKLVLPDISSVQSFTAPTRRDRRLAETYNLSRVDGDRNLEAFVLRGILIQKDDAMTDTQDVTADAELHAAPISSAELQEVATTLNVPQLDADPDDVLSDVQSTLNSLAGMAQGLSQQKQAAGRLQDELEEWNNQLMERERLAGDKEERLAQMETHLKEAKTNLDRMAAENNRLLAERSEALKELAQTVDARDRATLRKAEAIQAEQQRIDELAASLRARSAELDERESHLKRKAEELSVRLKQLQSAKDKFSAIVQSFNETVQFNSTLSAISKTVAE
ncbi:hypothetical protein [Pseudomonas sp. GCEP-101]|uniref:hypothetical protein n=1 Tax=Pseudomonas sp. GCEP-101 TaxID=2974552 RepID=UPI00223B3B65|nr:hypothetical protein [Pseudomonas sp. GCEP-101]